MTCPCDPNGCVQAYVDTLARRMNDAENKLCAHTAWIEKVEQELKRLKDETLERIAFMREQLTKPPAVEQCRPCPVCAHCPKPGECPEHRVPVVEPVVQWPSEPHHTDLDPLDRVCLERDGFARKLDQIQKETHT